LGASNLNGMHYSMPPLTTPRFAARSCKPCADMGRAELLGVSDRAPDAFRGRVLASESSDGVIYKPGCRLID
jgi:hypothetical protein